MNKPGPAHNQVNPFAAPQTADTYAGPDITEEERTRRAYLKRETSIRGAGSMYMLWGVVSLLVSVIVLVVCIADGDLSDPYRRMLLTPWFPVPLAGAVCIYIAALLHGLRPNSRTRGLVAIVMLVLYSLARFNVFNILGLMFHGYVICLLRGERGVMVLSDEYKSIIAKTPHIVYRRSMVMTLALLLFVALVAMMTAVLVRN